MVDTLERRDLDVLIEREELQATILMPTLPPGPEGEQNAIRLKNLLRSAERQLDGRGVSRATAERILAPARALQDDQGFWSNASRGLAVFIGEGWMRELRLPLDLPEGVWVGERPFIKPLLPLLTPDAAHFYVLAISQKRPRLFAGDRTGLEPVGIALPEGLDEVLADFSFEKSLQMHGGPRVGAGAGVPAGTFHGHGAGKDKERERLLELFRQVDRPVRAHLEARRAPPLILAGVDYLMPIYREASAYPALVEEGIAGNFDHAEPQQLHRRAWAIVEPRLRRTMRRDARRYRERAGGRQTTDSPDIVVAAAHRGRVETLFVDVDRAVQGRFDPDRGEVELADELSLACLDGPEEDLSNLAAVHTLLHGGKVHAVAAGQMPAADAALAALLRY